MILCGIFVIAIFVKGIQGRTVDSLAPVKFPATEDACTTPEGGEGACITLQTCPELFEILRNKPISPADLAQLRRYHCGFNDSMPKVCCKKRQGSQPWTTPAPLSTPQALPTHPLPEQSAPSRLPPNVVNHVNLRLLNHDICGPITAQKITGGEKTGVLDYPWMALLAYKINDKKIEYRCGGTVINKRYILTAAHCITGLPSTLKLIGARVGDHDLRTERDCDVDPVSGLEVVCAERYQDFGVESSIHHPEYSSMKFHNDIGLIRTNADIDFRPENVRPICLPIGSAAQLQHNNVIITGWGSTENGIKSQDLLRVNVPTVPNEECFRIYRDRKIIWYKQICAGGREGKDSCHGDSGGPLQATGMYNNSGRYIQYGIVSFGTRSCAVEGIPGVYTRVSYYTDWILDNMRD